MESRKIKSDSNKHDTSSKKYLEFKKKLQKYLNTYQIKKIEKAFSVATQAHEGQKRQSGEEYIEHPLSAASILADFRFLSTTIFRNCLCGIFPWATNLRSTSRFQRL